MKKALSLLVSLTILFSLAACGRSGVDSTADAPSTLVYASADYTRIDPAMDEHCEICLLYTSPSPRDYAASRMPSSA